MAHERRVTTTLEPLPLATAEHAGPIDATRSAPAPYRVRRLGSVRVPLAGAIQPWATLYRLPDGRELWCLRLPEEGVVRRRTATTATLLSYARRSGLRELEADILAVCGRTA